ncbi:hypothetical protein KK083_31875 [Fulvivirgaceae bacterium PWU4]|uniref:Gluconolaconase n=1 Tax=Chryseosolibacter histidini TaxID=2782349 RepID=A0AAP2DS33_9BACT|nr:hypothetical protein [Chryseosolibacter histidini]MBT1701535.1 hypothetical protein [Chryseosolibacter histidini]
MKRDLLIFIYLTSIITAFSQPPKAIFTKTERHVIPEGITVNPADGKIYVSSIALRKIIAIDSTGKCNDFITTGQDGFQEGLGLKIDPKKKWLWVVSNQKQGKWYTSQLHAFDLASGSLKQKYSIRDTVQHLFNDFTIHTNGKIYISDTYASSIYELDIAHRKLNLFLHDTLMLAGANGIAHNAHGRIYIATRKGLVHLDPVSKKLLPLAFSDSRRSLWLDGIVLWNNSIIGVADRSIVQYHLNAEGSGLVKERVIDEDNAFFRDPTTAAIFSNKLYVIANSYIGAYNRNNEKVAGIENNLEPVVILAYPLNQP